MPFEWDTSKSAANLEKHGIDFQTAQLVWMDENRVTGPGDVVKMEVRWLTVGMVNGKHWTVCWTRRDEKIRIISARTARDEERKVYEEN